MKRKTSWSLIILLLCTFILGSSFQQKEDGNPWTKAQVIQPAELVNELSMDSTGKILVLNIGPVDDIENAVNIGAIEHKKELKKLKKYLKHQDKDRAIVFYCGCCSMETCPNIKPAYALLDKMGFTNFKILNIEDNLKIDWMDKGYPMKKN